MAVPLLILAFVAACTETIEQKRIRSIMAGAELGAGNPGTLQGPAVGAGGGIANDDQSSQQFDQCSEQRDCVAVQEGGCCPHGRKVAVNRDQVEAYRESSRCTVQNQVCAMYLINDQRVAICNTAGRCEMVQPGQIPCGGFIRNAPQCPEGYTCKHLDLADKPGTCVKSGANPG